MKKTVKSSLLIMLMAVMLFALTGCGESKNNNENSDKIVATKSTSSEESLVGGCEETIEITLKNDKADKITWTMEFDDEESATTMSSMYNLAGSEFDDLEVKQDGKKVTMTMGTKAFASETSLDEENMTKDDIIKAFKEQGYTVK